MQNKSKVFVPLPLSAILKLHKIEAYKALTPEQIIALLVEEKLKATGC